jgi:hypothetical protein
VVVLEAFQEVGGLGVGMPGEAFDLASCRVGEDLVKINRKISRIN